MSELAHGSELTLAVTLGPMLAATGGTVRRALDGLAKAGFAAVQLDATLPSLRPRALDQRARRDLAALLTRSGLHLAGIDLFVPRRHYVEPAHVDRAVSATLAALELAADLGRVPVAVNWPVADMTADTREALVAAVDRLAVPLAVHAEDQLEGLIAWLNQVDQPLVGAGLDPAAVLAARGAPLQAVNALGRHLLVGRLSDAVMPGGLRCAAGAGELDLLRYRVALDLAPRRVGPVVLDLRGVENAPAAAVRSRDAWHNAAFTL